MSLYPIDQEEEFEPNDLSAEIQTLPTLQSSKEYLYYSRNRESFSLPTLHRIVREEIQMKPIKKEKRFNEIS